MRTHDSDDTLVKARFEKHHHERNPGAVGHQERGEGQRRAGAGERGQRSDNKEAWSGAMSEFWQRPLEAGIARAKGMAA